MSIDMKIVTEFICKLINESVFNYSSEANFKMLPCLFHFKIYKVNFSDLDKDFYTSEDDIFAILLLTIDVVIKSVFIFMI